jgi:hypothetical protein
MTYTLDFQFQPEVDWRRLQAYFAERRHYEIDGYELCYRNPDTLVTLLFSFERGRWSPLRKNIAAGSFTLQYLRAGFFGLEAERELSALMAAFGPRIEDPQMQGMGDGPYSGDGFLHGWNFGNQLAVRALLSRDPDLDIATLPAAVLTEVWRWNYASTADRMRFRDRRFIPHITLFRRGGQPSRFVIWPSGMPVSLPWVDYVMTGRGYKPTEQSFGLVSWSELVEALARAGVDTTRNPIELEYFRTPKDIERWLATIPPADLGTLERIEADDVLDAETVAAAREAGPLIPSRE